MTPTFQGEMQLAGWSESHNGGCKVTFWLADSSDLEAFRVMTVRKGNTAGQRLACVLVEVGDDEQPVEPEPKRDQRGPLCREAIDLCASVDFWDWTLSSTSADAKHWLLGMLSIQSRKELDSDPEKGKAFVSMVRIPFMKWMRERKAA